MDYGNKEVYLGGRMRHEILVQLYRLGGDRDGIRILDITPGIDPLYYTVEWKGTGIPTEVLNGVLERVRIRTHFAAVDLYGLAGRISGLDWDPYGGPH